MRALYIIGLFIFFFSSPVQASMAGTRNANPTYTRMPKIYQQEVVVVQPIVTPQPLLIAPPQGQYVENQQFNPNVPNQEAPLQVIQTTPVAIMPPAQGQYSENQQLNPNTPNQGVPVQVIQNPRQEEVAGYSLMRGTTDPYGGIDIR